MDTLQFFEKVLPAEGIYFLAEFTAGLNRPPRHTQHTTRAALAARAVQIDAGGVNVYHACHGFAAGADGVVARKQANAARFRALYADLDVGDGKPYATQRAAAMGLLQACRAIALPTPMLVSSGRGVHAYWPLDRDIPTQAYWAAMSGKLQTALLAQGVGIDLSVTTDAARILRPVGTHHRKAAPLLVECRLDAGPYTVEELLTPLKPYAWAGATPSAAVITANSDLAAPEIEFPPSSVGRIIAFCPTIAHIADTGGSVPEPLWHAGIGLFKHTVEGEVACHTYSQGDARYDPEQTQAKIDAWTGGPTTCAKFRATEGNQCAGCARTCKSPIHLGYPDELPAPAAAEPTAATEPTAPPLPPDADGLRPVTTTLGDDDTKYFPRKTVWQKPEAPADGGPVQGRHLMSRLTKSNADDPPEPVPFTTTPVIAVNRIRTIEGTWDLLCKAFIGGAWRRFDVPGKALATADALLPYLAQHEVAVLPRKGPLMLSHLTDGRDLLAEAHVQSVAYDALGWADPEGEGGIDTFVLGGIGIQPGRTVEVIPSQRLRAMGWGGEFRRAGTRAEYCALLDAAFNRPGAEMLQFLLLAGYAAPLVELGASDNWHGIPIALTGDTSAGKTTLCRAACAIYGPGADFVQPANKAGTTLNALFARVSTIRNLPFVMDEITGADTATMGDILYAMSNGRPKDRCNTKGYIENVGRGWNTISFVTGNQNIGELLSRHAHRATAEATQVRVFEIRYELEDARRIIPDDDARQTIEKRLGEEQYGLMGRLWLQHVVANRAAISRRVQDERYSYGLNSNDERRERFFYDLVATVTVAAEITRELGYHKFDVAAIKSWALGNIAVLRGDRAENAHHAENAISGLLRYLYGRVAVTKFWAPGNTAAREVSSLELRLAPLARVATMQQVFMVTNAAIVEYAREARVDAGQLITDMIDRGMILLPPPDAKNAQSNRGYQARPFAGVAGVFGTSCTVFRLNYDIWSGAAELAPAEVTPLHAAGGDERQ